VATFTIVDKMTPLSTNVFSRTCKYIAVHESNSLLNYIKPIMYYVIDYCLQVCIRV